MSRRNREASSPAWRPIALGLLVTAVVVAALSWWGPDVGTAIVIAGTPVLVPHWLLSALFGSAVVSLTVLPHVRRRHLTAIGDASEPRTAQPAIPERRMASGAAPPAAARSLHDREDDDDRRMGIVRRPASTGRAPEPATVTVLAAGAFAQAVEQARRSVALEGGVYRIRRELYGRQPDARASLRRTAELTC